jgi:hypothetical protein
VKLWRQADIRIYIEIRPLLHTSIQCTLLQKRIEVELVMEIEILRSLWRPVSLRVSWFSYQLRLQLSAKKTETKLRGFSLQANYATERPPLVFEVSVNYAARGCRVVSATDPQGR